MEFEDEKYLVFRVGEGEFGVPIRQVVSIERMQSVTPLPNMPESMAGLINLRGTVTPIVDLRQVFKQIQQDNSLILVVHVDGNLTGLMVDDANDILDIPANSIQYPKIVQVNNLSYLLGISKLNDRLIILLDANLLLQNFTLLKSLNELKEAL